MKKRFMLVAVLLGSLALASCVDDKESWKNIFYY